MDPVLQKKIKYSLIAGVVLLVLFLVYLLLTTASYSKITVHPTPFSDRSFTALQGNSLYSYNGAGFYKVDSKTNNIQIISSSARLPNVTNLYWAGDKGALMTFSDDGLIGSDVEKELASRGISPETDTQSYLWYLDFKSGKLHLVQISISDLVRVEYSAISNQFNFVAHINTAPNGIDSEYLTSYLSYSLADQTVKTLVNDIGFDEVTFVGQCKKTLVCVLQTGEESKLWTEVSGVKQTVYDFKKYDSVTATGVSDQYIVTKNDAVATNEDEEDGQLQASPSLLNLDGKIIPLTEKVSVNTPLIANALNIEEAKNYIIDTATKNTESVSHYLSTGKTLLGAIKTKQFTLQLDDGSDFTSHVLGNISYGNNGTALFTDIDHNIFYVTDSSATYKITELEESKLESAIQQCLDKYTTFHEYTSEIKQLRVGIKYDQNYSQTISSFSKCVATVSPQAFIGYNYTFVGVDPISGRFVTN